MKDVALVTGASSGIGRDLARIHAAHGGDLVVVARRLDALEELKADLEKKYGGHVLCIGSDLAEPGAPLAISLAVAEQGIEVEYLINNAGFGGYGLFHQRSWGDDEKMIKVNVLALCELCHLFSGKMADRGSGKILNVASIAGFLPGPLQATYYATKAFVVSFSQALAEEMKQFGVSVTTLCPGPVATEFGSRANVEDTPAFRTAASSYDVALLGYNAMRQGKLIAIDDKKLSFLLGWVVPLLPRKLILTLSRRMMEKGA